MYSNMGKKGNRLRMEKARKKAAVNSKVDDKPLVEAVYDPYKYCSEVDDNRVRETYITAVDVARELLNQPWVHHITIT